jgi:uncharacterized protein (TIRG00374 family)
VEPVFISGGSPIQYNPSVRNVIIALIFLLALVFVFINIAEVEAVVGTLQQGDLRYLVLALGIQVVWTLNVAFSFQSVYRALGLDERIEKLVILVVAANFINVVAPSGGLGGVAIFINEARQRRYSAGRVTIAGVLVVLFDYIGFLVVLFLGLLVLVRRNNLTPAEVIPASILALVAGVLVALVFLAMRSAEKLGGVLAWMVRFANRLLRPFIKREYLSESRAHIFASEAAEGLGQLRQRPGSLTLPLLLGLSSKAIMITILLVVFLAFNVPFSAGTLIAGFSIGYLFLIVSPTPAGIGFVEGALTLSLRSLNVPLGAATVITLAYRGITLWIPLLFGMIAFRWLSGQQR